MTKVIIIGHGGYGTAIKNNLKMLMGEVENYFYIDFNIEDDLDILDKRISEAIGPSMDIDVLFACDLTGGSPFRQVCLLASEHPNFVVVAGINTAAYAEMVYSLSLPPRELAKLAIETAKEAISVFSVWFI